MEKTTILVTTVLLIVLFGTFLVSAGEDDTMLMVTMDVKGECKNPGDSCFVRVNVTNIGSKTAREVHVTLVGTANNSSFWSPYERSTWIPSDESSYFWFYVTRGDQPDFYAIADAVNAKKTISQTIQIPIHPGILFGLALSFVGIVYTGTRVYKKPANK